MPTFHLTAPDGTNYDIDGPEGSTLDEAVEKARQYHDRDRSLSEIPGEALSNLPSSAGRLVKNIAQPFLHPIETATGLKNVAEGALEKTGLKSGSEHEQYVDAIGQMIKDRYGSWANFKRTLATDPAGAAADLSLVLTGGGSALARAPGVVGEIGETAAAVGRLAPVTKAAGKVAGKAGEAVAGLQGVMTGKGGETFSTAYRAGKEGGARATDFYASMSGAEPIVGVVEDARNAVKQLRQERGEAYRAGMAQIAQDKTVLDFNDIDQEISKAMRIKTFKGQELSPSTTLVRDQMIAEINKWKMLNPQEFHTAEGLDALKQKLGDLAEAEPFGTPARTAANEIYNAVRGTIVKQAPAYAKVMSGYEIASQELKAIERELSVNPKASVDTALRKITAALRDNVNANFGRRRELVEFLAQNGAPHLLEKIAGQSLKNLMPEGLSRLAVSGEGAGALLAVAAGNPFLAAKLAAVIAMHSPRLHGELAYRAGQVVGGVGRAASPLAPAARTAARLPLPDISLGALQTGRLGGPTSALGATALSPQGTAALEQP